CRNASSALPSLPITALMAAAVAPIRLITRWVVNPWVSCSSRGASEIIVFITCTLLLVVVAAQARLLDFSSTCPGHGLSLFLLGFRGASRAPVGAHGASSIASAWRRPKSRSILFGHGLLSGRTPRSSTKNS